MNIPIQDRIGELAVIATREFDVPFRYGSTVRILGFNGQAVQIQSVGAPPAKGFDTVLLSDLYWERKDNGHYP